MSLVWKTDLKPNQRLVLLAYADHANDEGKAVRPSRATVARKTGYSESQVQRITKSLEKTGILKTVSSGHRGAVAVREIDVGLLNIAAHLASQSGSDSGASVTDSGAYSAEKRRMGAPPNHQEPSEPRDRDAEVVDISNGIPHHYCLDAHAFVDIPIAECSCKTDLGATRKEQHA